MKDIPNISRAALAIILSKLKTFDAPKLKEEQYSTDSDIAASLLWDLYMKGRIVNKRVADLGAGTGLLGLGAAILGAKEVILVEKDPEALAAAKENIAYLRKSVFLKLRKICLLKKDVKDIQELRISNFGTDLVGLVSQVDLVIMNPPFGTKKKHADLDFLEAAFKIAPEIYSFHKASTAKFIIRFCASKGFRAEPYLSTHLPIKACHSFHKRRLHKIEVVCFRITKTL